MTQTEADTMTSATSNMEKILATAPSLDEEEVNKFKPDKGLYRAQGQ